MHRKTQSTGNLKKLISRIVFAVFVAATLAFAIAPDLTKPLFVKFYRTIYSAEVVRQS